MGNILAFLAAKAIYLRSIDKYHQAVRKFSMDNKILIFFSLVIILMASACKRDSADIVIAEILLNEELNLAFREQFHTNGEADIIAKITTASEYECDKGKLRTTLVKTNNNEILLNVIGLDFSETAGCEGEDVAKTELNLGFLPLGVEFNLQILLLGELKTSGSITNTANSIIIDLPVSGDAAVNIDEGVIKKVPQGSAWGFISSETEVSDSMTQLFINQMEALGYPLENPGVYGSFEIDFSGDAKINDFELEGRTIVQNGFAIDLNEDFSVLEALAEDQYCNENFRIRMWDTFGKNFACN